MIENFINKIKEYKINPTIIFDIGSRDLNESIAFRQYYPNAEIYAFEPNPEQSNECYIKANQYNIKFFNKAITDNIGQNDFFAVQKNGPNPNIGASALSYFSEEQLSYWKEVDPNSQPNVKTYKIQTTSLDCFCEQNNIFNIDALWLDVQGYELKVLEGGRKILKNIKIIHTELSFKKFYNETAYYPEVKSFLEKNNFIEVWNRNEYHPEYKNFRHRMEVGLTDSIFLNSQLL